jgi:uncharacterized membrane protein
MLPEPLHPAVVHFPIVLVVLLPLVALAALIIIKRGGSVRSSWLPVVALSAALAGASWLAVQTGEREEDVVEQVVAESAIHEHEERAELFFPLTLAAVLFVSAGLLQGRPGRVMRGASLALALGLMYAGYQVGHSGGELVYEHGAAKAYSQDSGQTWGDRTSRDVEDEDRQAEDPQDEDRQG